MAADFKNKGDIKDYQIGGHSSGVANAGGKSKANTDKHTHNVNKNQWNDGQLISGDSETRPDNVAFYTYMKVNNVGTAPEPEPDVDPDQVVMGSALFDDTSATEAYITLDVIDIYLQGVQTDVTLAFKFVKTPIDGDDLTSKLVYDKQYVDVQDNSYEYLLPSVVDNAYVILTGNKHTMRLKLYPQEVIMGLRDPIACSWTFDSNLDAVSGNAVLEDGTHFTGYHAISASLLYIQNDTEEVARVLDYLVDDKWLPMRELSSPDDDDLIEELLEDLITTPIPLNNGIPDRTVFRVGNQNSLPFRD